MAGESSETRRLLDRCQDGDRAALETLLARDLDWIRQRVRARLGPKLRRKIESGDLLQETVIEALRYGPRFRVADRGEFRAILARVVENVIRGVHDRFTAQCRALDREERLPGESGLALDPATSLPPTASQLACDRERHERLRLAMSLLDPSDRDVISLREWESLTYAEIGRRLGVEEDAARMRCRRALLELAEIVKRLERGGLADWLDREESGA